VRTELTCGAARLAAVLAGLAIVVSVPVALGADGTLQESRTTEARASAASLADRAQTALLTLYALETKLARAHHAVAALDARRARLAKERGSVRRQLGAARRSARASQQRLARLVRALYERNGAEPLAVLLGADSLDEALTSLDGLSRAAHEHRRILGQARLARRRLAALDARLAARDAELRRLTAEATSHARMLQAAATSRADYVDSLRRHQDLTENRLAALEAQARTAGQRTTSLRARQAPVVSEPASVEVRVAQWAGPRTLTVAAVGYSLPGHTASGLPVGHGIAAVDPSVIPLGAQVFVPGYGDAVAADTGGAVQGATIDLWFPTAEAALAWGRRTVVITVS
jgi:peptidoglycan DL-endopeptidase CwlO